MGGRVEGGERMGEGEVRERMGEGEVRERMGEGEVRERIREHVCTNNYNVEQTLVLHSLPGYGILKAKRPMASLRLMTLLHTHTPADLLEVVGWLRLSVHQQHVELGHGVGGIRDGGKSGRGKEVPLVIILSKSYSLVGSCHHDEFKVFSWMMEHLQRK